MRDCCIIGAGASGLFVGMHLPKKWKKLTLEHTKTAGFKILLSGGGRCNFTNMRASFKTYLGDETERLLQIFSLFGPKDMIAFLRENGIESKEEDNGRMLLMSNKARELLDFLLRKNEENLTEIRYEHKVLGIEKIEGGFLIRTSQGDFESKRVILACGGQGFPKVCGTDFVFEFAKSHQLQTHSSMPALCGLETKEDFSLLSGSSVECRTQLIIDGTCIYEDDRVVLFTHWGLSGPAIFNVSLWLGYHYPQLKKNIKIRLSIPSSAITKRLLTFLKAPKGLKNYTLTAIPVAFRGRDECKVMSGGLLFGQVDEHFELKGMPWMYVLGEALNITGKTWGYNLQWCWSSAWVCAKALRELDKIN